MHVVDFPTHLRWPVIIEFCKSSAKIENICRGCWNCAVLPLWHLMKAYRRKRTCNSSANDLLVWLVGWFVDLLVVVWCFHACMHACMHGSISIVNDTWVRAMWISCDVLVKWCTCHSITFHHSPLYRPSIIQIIMITMDAKARGGDGNGEELLCKRNFV